MTNHIVIKPFRTYAVAPCKLLPQLKSAHRCFDHANWPSDSNNDKVDYKTRSQILFNTRKKCS